jgi:formate hydrogenlyase subunit 6/NADH:ubiquinone oxidoreductase subunit I
MHVPQKAGDGRYLPDELATWVLSCVGCGMCEQACQQHTALHLIFSRVRDELEKTV